ncbi:MocR-like pyridoxine biosynthesis transcription factor PdxR [Lachnoclostridium sp. Marseille-P6806]|uniref:MocR-like pyridoxine biosynthesis transcription factor PdxR n=1 Tax=Lachnoclostridium sp. Marseille-P6806 TaxID=2364793 RepID=UPI00103014AF|nr:PLP-dependent aminotransferase family protein [Lachnoclostridium sp. Marseille-P6806]
MQELNITLDSSGGSCLYEQIYLFIRNGIREGRLRPGERLPSTRALASFLSIARSTVQSAYDQLLSEGYIEPKRNRGYFVCDIENLFSFPEKRERNARDGLRRESSEPPEEDGVWREGTGLRREENGARREEAGARREERCGEREERPRIDFSPRRIDMSHFPYQTWKRISRNTLVDANSEMFSLGEPNGDLSFRETIARYLYLSRGVCCSEEQIVIGAGNDFLLLLLREILGGDRRIGMEYATYRRACRIFESVGYHIVPAGMDESGMQVSSLRSGDCSLAYVMPAHQYPTGVTMPIARRLELLSWAAEGRDRWIIEDDYDSEFRYRGRPIPSLQASDTAGCVIYIGTFSKAIAPAIRVSYMILPPALARVYHERFRFFSSTVSRLDQRQLDGFLRGGFFERYLNRMRNRYRMKHDIMIRELRDFSSRFALLGEGAGLHLLLRERQEMPPEKCMEKEKALEREACAAGVRIYPLSENFAVPPERLPREQICYPAILLGYAALSPEEIREGVRVLRGIWLS